ncbi:MAG: polysaccharide deacetylase family protein [Flavobacteriaceae bacterium]|nr:polysaccharide deacetylase family protein [Flavobacteriaceae bacterium]
MLDVFSTTPILKRLFPQYIWEVSDSKDEIFLTFDDGPQEGITDWTLDVLKKYKAKATFFCLGKNISKYPKLFERIINEGHSIGNHTYDHLKGWNVSKERYLEDIFRCQEIIQDNAGSSLSHKLFRPPYGKIKPTQAKETLEHGFKIVMWTVIAYDWRNDLEPKKCLNRVIDTTENGSIVVLHDSIKAERNMKFVLPRALEHFSKRGYNFKALA